MNYPVIISTSEVQPASNGTVPRRIGLALRKPDEYVTWIQNMNDRSYSVGMYCVDPETAIATFKIRCKTLGVKHPSLKLVIEETSLED